MNERRRAEIKFMSKLYSRMWIGSRQQFLSIFLEAGSDFIEAESDGL